ncbi:addiction module antidote protein, HigA family [Dyella jiangningensis]|nr:addiction module antidote protein, HigA family [Dyella jiangningensis]
MDPYTGSTGPVHPKKTLMPPILTPPPVPLHPQMQLDPTAPVRAPGAVLREDYLRPMAWKTRGLAQRSGIPVWHLRSIMQGAPLYAEEAFRLSAALGTSPFYWLALQARYDLLRVECSRRQDSWARPARGDS